MKWGEERKEVDFRLEEDKARGRVVLTSSSSQVDSKFSLFSIGARLCKIVAMATHTVYIPIAKHHSLVQLKSSAHASRYELCNGQV